MGADFASDVRRGLTSDPKTLPPKYFYDDMGSLLFEAICLLPEYYVTRAEHAILTNHCDDIVEALTSPVRVVELGSGNAGKTRILIDTILKRQPSLEYVPIDISESALENSSRELLKKFPRLQITAFAADYASALSSLATRAAPGDMRTLVLFLGGTVGNLDPTAARALMGKMRRMLEEGDCLLLGTDMKKPHDVLTAAYDDAQGVTSAFNLNMLTRINRELGGEFDLRRFRHKARYNKACGRIEMHLASTIQQSVPIRSLGLEVHFRRGETIHTENSYKFDAAEIRLLAEESGFKSVRTWYDADGFFGLSLLVAVG